MARVHGTRVRDVTMAEYRSLVWSQLPQGLRSTISRC